MRDVVEIARTMGPEQLFLALVFLASYSLALGEFATARGRLWAVVSGLVAAGLATPKPGSSAAGVARNRVSRVSVISRLAPDDVVVRSREITDNLLTRLRATPPAVEPGFAVAKPAAKRPRGAAPARTRGDRLQR